MTSRDRNHDPSELLLRRTRRRLASFTLLLVTALVAVVGISTVLVARGLMQENVDRALRAVVADQALLHALFDDDDEQTITPLGSSDTFILLVDETATALRNPSDVSLEGLPDRAAVEAARRGEDLRDGRYGGVDVRLLTVPAADFDDDDDDDVPRNRPAFVQVGIVLTLQNAQQRELLLAVLGVALLGLVGATFVTVLVTRRALVPIRAAFATERRFVAAASHELRTPVAVIRASAEIIERERLVTEEGAPLVGDVIGEADRLGRLVGDLLALASAETGSVEVQRRALDLRPWFVGVSRRADALARSRAIELEVISPPGNDAIVVSADDARLEQLLHILIDNALEHSPPGEAVVLRLVLDADARIARLSVSDEGPGIPEAERERVFEPFARIKGERRSETGTGLGLAIARQLAFDHDAQLIVVSEGAPGATLELRLPLAPPGH